MSSAIEPLAISSSEDVSPVAESNVSCASSSNESLLVSSSLLVSCSFVEQSSSSMNVYVVSHGEMTDDRDGQVYKTITIEGEFAEKRLHKIMESFLTQVWILRRFALQDDALISAFFRPSLSSRCP